MFLCHELFFFFFKQKTAYERRISDWSSDVCSSDLLPSGGVVIQAIEQAIHPGRNGSTAHSREFPGLRNVRYRQYARYDFRINPRRRRLVPETKAGVGGKERSEEHTSELQSLMSRSYAVFCLQKNNNKHLLTLNTQSTIHN